MMSHNMKQKEQKFIELPPSPSCLVESLRDIGYSMPTAIADLLDNSITAKASEISVRCCWNDGQPWIAVVDNGIGMTKKELINAMRLGSLNPIDKRREDDLGRFGLGMKTASFSQCRHLTVISKHKDNAHFACEWNLDNLASDNEAKWRLSIVSLGPQNGDQLSRNIFTKELEQLDSGTVVLWRNLDRVAPGESQDIREDVFNSHIDNVREHLSCVFHRFLSGSRGQSKITIKINNDPLEPFDPFYTKHNATQELPEQKITLDGKEIVVQAYVLPHHNKTSKEDWDKFAGPGGYHHNQGFYVYRNKRLIISGTWFRLLKKQELTKLIRVRVDIPNSLDHLWGIDVKKSHASPPERVREELRKVIEKIEYCGKKVYKQRGTVLNNRAKVPFWNRVAREGGISYEINREHPLLTKLLDRLESEQISLLKDLVSSFESTFPKDLYYNDMASTPEMVMMPEIPDESLHEILKRLLHFFADDGNLDSVNIENIMHIEPFASNKEITKQILLEGMHG